MQRRVAQLRPRRAHGQPVAQRGRAHRRRRARRRGALREAQVVVRPQVDAAQLLACKSADVGQLDRPNYNFMATYSLGIANFSITQKVLYKSHHIIVKNMGV